MVVCLPVWVFCVVVDFFGLGFVGFWFVIVVYCVAVRFGVNANSVVHRLGNGYLGFCDLFLV